MPGGAGIARKPAGTGLMLVDVVTSDDDDEVSLDELDGLAFLSSLHALATSNSAAIAITPLRRGIG